MKLWIDPTAVQSIKTHCWLFMHLDKFTLELSFSGSPSDIR